MSCASNRLIAYVEKHRKATPDLDLVVGFAVRDHIQCAIDMSSGNLVNSPCDLTIYFTDEQSAVDLLSGDSHPIQAFMQGELRASGYIVETFRVLGSLR